MSSTVSVQKWCDNLVAHDMDTEPATVARTVLDERGKPVELDLCDGCDELIQAVHALAMNGSPITAGKLKKSGQRPPSTAEREFPCPRCDYAAVTRDSFGKHVRRQHDITTREATSEMIAKQSHVAAQPTVLVEGPLPKRTSRGSGRPPADVPTPWKCKVPKCWHPGSVSLNGLWQHAVKHHNLTRAEYRQRYGAPVEETD